ncbi:MAG: hypothetical protein D3924_04965 [Candidatus Electrothrix sp. AR4]|nr:hypothetical protein [Candidatus Electrothrix sp. AR4]
MPEEDNSSKNIDYFRKKMEKHEDYMTMHLPRSFAYKAEQLFGNDFASSKRVDLSNPRNDKDK